MAIREEAVRLTLVDDFSTQMAKAAATTALLNRELNNLSGQAVVTTRVSQNIARDTDNIARSANRAESSINQLTGRLRLFADLAAILGPSLAPIGAVAIPAVAGLANQLGVAALAGGTAIIAFQGVGDALKAVNEAALEPTAENLAKAGAALEALSPAAREMVSRLQELRPVLTDLRDVAAEGLFPGMIDGIDELETRIPELERILSNVSTTLGSLMRDMGQDLASDRWNEFFDFLATDATTTLAAMGRVVGSLAHGFAQLWMAFDPLNDDFSGWMQDVAAGFDSWASGLAQTEGFREFIDYVRTNGPQVADTFGALADAVLQIVEASAPLGGPVLQALEAVARVIASIADSDLGTPIMAGVLALGLLSRATRTYEAIAATTWGTRRRAEIGGMVTALGTVTSAQDRARLSVAQLARVEAQRADAVRSGLATMGKAAAVVGALTLATTGAAEGIGLSNTATLGLMGTLAGPFGAALGTSAGLFLDMRSAIDQAADSTARFNAALDSGSTAMQRNELEQLTARLNDLSDIDPWEFGKWAEAGGLGAPEIEKIRGQIEALKAALDAPNNVGGGLAGVLGGDLPRALGMTADQFDLAARSANDFARALQGLAGFLDKREALRNYQQALDDFSASIKDNGKSFDIATEKGRNNAEALDRIADSAMQTAQQMKGLDRVRTLTRAAEDIRTLAKELGIPPRLVQVVIDKLKEAARTDAKPKVEVQGTEESNRKLDGVDKKFKGVDALLGGPTVTADTGQANAALAGVQARLNAIQSKTVFVNVRTIGGPQAAPMADGGTVPGQRVPYGDKTLIYAAPGEEVISNRYGQADRFRADRAARRIPAYADGGTVGPGLDVLRAVPAYADGGAVGQAQAASMYAPQPVLSSMASGTGSGALSAEIGALRREMNAESRAMRRDLQKAGQSLQEFNRTGPERTGKAVGDKINSAAASGKRRRG